MRPVQIRSGRRPFQVAALASSLLIGVALLLVPTRPQSLAHTMPGWVQAAWCVAAIFSGAVGLAGVYWPGQRDSSRLEWALGVERIGVAAFGVIATMDAFALATFGLSAIPSGLFAAAFAFGAWWRVAEITRDRRLLAVLSDAGTVADVPLIVRDDGGPP